MFNQNILRLSQLPSIKPDEHIISLAIRACITSANPKTKTFFTDNLSVEPTLNPVEYLQNTLQQKFISIYSNIYNHSPIKLIWSHTNTRYYFNSLPTFFQKFIISGNSLEVTPKALSKLHSKANVKLVQTWRWCPDCAKNDELKYGFSYWHVSHQIPGVIFCSTHPQTMILDQCNHCGFSYKNLLNLDLPPEDGICKNCNNLIIPSSIPSDHELTLSYDTLKWISLPPGFFTAEKLSTIFRQAAKKKNSRIASLDISPISSDALCTINKRLQPYFDKFYGEDFIKKLAKSYKFYGKDHSHSIKLQWLMTKNVEIHPTWHLLLARFLFDDINDFFDNRYENHFSKSNTEHKALSFIKDIRNKNTSIDNKKIARDIFYLKRD